MNTSHRNSILLSIFIFFAANTCSKAQEEINIHYLGHAAFVIEFNDSIQVLTDFGTSNCWGYNSPIYGIGDFVPLIMTYSHYHDDHYDPDRIPEGVTYTLDSLDSLDFGNLSIRPVRTCETTPGVESNTSFIFEYMGFRICHLGDAQAEIMNIEDPAQQALILEKFPDRIDLLFMTIEGIYSFIPEAELFIDLLQPGMVVPIHYWSPEYKEEFLTYLELQNDTAGKNYEVNRFLVPTLDVMTNDTIHSNIRVYGLSPTPFGPTRIINGQTEDGLINIQVYPNPANEYAYVCFSSPGQIQLSLDILDIKGRTIVSRKNIQARRGINKVMLELDFLTSGLYFLMLQDQYHCHVKRMIINK